MKVLLILGLLAAILFAGYHYVSLDEVSGIVDHYSAPQGVPED